MMCVPETEATLVTTKSVPSHGSMQQEIPVFRAGLWHPIPQYLKDTMQNWYYILEPTLGDSTSPILLSALDFQLASTSQNLCRHILLPAGQFSQSSNFQQVLDSLP